MISRRDALKLAAAGLAAPSLGVTAPQQSIAAQEAGSNVPMFRGNAARTGEMPGPGPSLDKPIVVKWKSATGSHVSGLYLIDDIMYISGYENNNGYLDSYLIAIDNITKREKWRFESDSDFSAPTVADSIVYTSSHSTKFDWHGYVHAIDVDSGQEIWNFITEDSFNSAPIVIGGIVYVTSNDFNIYAIDAKTGQEVWRFTTAESDSASLFVVDGIVYNCRNHREDLGSGISNIQAGVVYAIDAKSGQEYWRFSTGESAAANLIVGGDTAFVQDSDGSSLYAIDAGSGKERWKVTNERYGSPIEVDGALYVGSSDNNIYAIDVQSGQERWRLTAGDSVTRKPSVVDDILYVGSSDHNLYAVDIQSGSEQWQFDAEGWGIKSPAVFNGVAYFIGGSDNTLFAIDATTGQELWRFAPGYMSSSPIIAGGTVCIVSGDVFVLGNLEVTVLVDNAILRGGPSDAGVERGTAKVGDIVSTVGTREEREGKMWAEVTIGDVTGWIPLDAIDPATLPPEGEIEYVYVPE